MADTSEDDDGSASAPVVDLASGLLMAALAVLALAWIIPANVDADAGDYDVSPVFMPKLAAWIVLALGLLLAASAVRRASGAWRSAPWSIVVDPLAWAGVSVLVYLSLMHLGFLVTAPAVIAGGLLYAGQRSPIIIAIISIGLPLLLNTGAWQIFQVALP